MDLRAEKTVIGRRRSLERTLKVSLKNIGTFSLDETVASKRNCENMIGVAQIPIGVAGPLRIDKREFYVPLATTEGALVASINRGAKAIMGSGGASVFVNKVGTTRGPVFETKNLAESFKFKNWLNAHFKDLGHRAMKTSPHIKLLKLGTKIVGNNVYIRFYFDTSHAMGMNMVSIATSEIAKYVEKKTGVKLVSLSGNYCIDKKPAWLNFVSGRGFEVWAEVTLSKKVLRQVLKTSPEKFIKVWLDKCMIGSALSGSMGFNAQFANVVAGIFLATGQDPGHIVEGSMGITTAEKKGESLRVDIYLPAIMVGTVGGGTGLATQKEALSITGVKKPEDLAKIIGAAVLAGEISLLSSLSEGSLVKAHDEKYRNR